MVPVIRIATAGLGLCFCVAFVACTRGTAPNGDDSASAGSGNAAGSGSAGANSDGGMGGGVMDVDASTSCSDLFTLARHQLDEAAACVLDAGTAECSGLVDASCGCRVSVDSDTSDATLSYLNTLAVIQEKKCGGTCPPLFCEQPGPGTCVPQAGSNGGVCIHRP